MGHLLSCIYPCFQLWVTSPLWVTCLVVSAHAFSTGSQVLYGSLVRLYLPMLSALDHKSSMGRLFGHHKSSMGRLFGYHKSSMGHLFGHHKSSMGHLFGYHKSSMGRLFGYHKSSMGRLFSFTVFVYSLVLFLSLLLFGIQI